MKLYLRFLQYLMTYEDDADCYNAADNYNDGEAYMNHFLSLMTGYSDDYYCHYHHNEVHRFHPLRSINYVLRK